MKITAPIMNQSTHDFIADVVGPRVSWPTYLEAIADAIAATNPSFNRERFINRATNGWEQAYEPPILDDWIPYDT
jgi:hypothetical protein